MAEDLQAQCSCWGSSMLGDEDSRGRPQPHQQAASLLLAPCRSGKTANIREEMELFLTLISLQKHNPLIGVWRGVLIGSLGVQRFT